MIILLVQIIAGLVNPNEDKELIRQRRVRGAEHDRELGIAQKPAWWKRNEHETMRERIARNVREVGGGRATATNIEGMIENRTREVAPASNIEMGEMANPVSTAGTRPAVTPLAGTSSRIRSDLTMQQVAGLLFPGAENTGMTPERLSERTSYLSESGPPPPPYTGIHGQQRGRPRSIETVGNGAPHRPTTAERSASATTTHSVAGPPQQIKSMLDV